MTDPPPSDRHPTPNWLRPTTAALLVIQLWSAMSAPYVGGPRVIAVEAAAVLCAALAVFGLPSVPLRAIALTSTILSGLLLFRFGLLGADGGLGGTWRVLVWLAVTGAALAVTARSARVGLGSIRSALPSIAVAVSVVCAVGLLAGPRVADAVPVGSTIREGVDSAGNHPGNPLQATDTLDMTTRPQLSDRVVMTVRSPVASFWRTTTYDTWNGSQWSRSAGSAGSLLAAGEVSATPDDVAARAGSSFEQQVQLRAGFATALPVAPSAVRVDSDHQLAHLGDGTIVAVDEPLGRGASYTVESRQVPTSLDGLRVLGRQEIPESIIATYSQRPTATARTAALAEDLTAGLDSSLDKVQAIEHWMGANTGYALDAPLSPQGVDVVDDFLFESQLGWCEQIASSLVVMARLAGVPARLASGYVPGRWDPVAERFVVREREAHSWAEVWFPEVGWVPFDPTAEVPLAGSAASVAGSDALRFSDALGAALLVLVATTVLCGPSARAARRRLDDAVTARRRRRMIREHWDVAEEVEIEQIGNGIGRPRQPGETLVAFARALVERGADAGLVDRAVAIDRHRYGSPLVPAS